MTRPFERSRSRPLTLSGFNLRCELCVVDAALDVLVVRVAFNARLRGDEVEVVGT